jgi:subtilisin family serine protease
MDPALLELTEEGAADDEVSVIIRLVEETRVPQQVRVVSRFGKVVTARLQRGDIQRTWESPLVASLKAARPVAAPLPYEPEFELEEHGPGEDFFGGPAPGRPASVRELGTGVIVGVCDWGLDFTHPNFRNPDGSTRLLGFWDQRGRGGTTPQPWGYGRFHSRDEINAALRQPNPFAALGYDLHRSDGGRHGTHGTHVTDIAAGNRRAPGSTSGIASGADLLFVEPTSLRMGNLADFGDSVCLLEALDFLRKTAAGRPCVINLSAGKTGGEHRGTNPFELAVDAMLTAQDNLVLVQSVGNYGGSAMHSHARIGPSQQHTLKWLINQGDRTPNELEIWYNGEDVFDATLISPRGDRFAVPLGDKARLQQGSEHWGNFYHRMREPNSSLNHIDIFLRPAAPAGTWRVELAGNEIVDGRFHAWIERDAGGRHQSHFAREQATPNYTTNTICNSMRGIAVGAYDCYRPDRPPTVFSSRGPTADERLKPEVSAPGYKIRAARSVPEGGWAPDQSMLTVKSGTSMASPYVAGTVALMFEAAKRPLSSAEVKRVLIGTADPPPDGARSSTRLGYGYVNIEAAVAAVRGSAAPVRQPRRVGMDRAGAFEHADREADIERDPDANDEALEGSAAEQDAPDRGWDAHHEDESSLHESADVPESEDGQESANEGDESTTEGDEFIALETESLDEGMGAGPPARPSARRFASQQRLFDTVAHGHVDFGSAAMFEDVGDESPWQLIAGPGAPISISDIRDGDLALRRALGEGRLTTSLIVGEHITADQLFGADGLVRRDTMILRAQGYESQAQVEAVDVEAIEAVDVEAVEAVEHGGLAEVADCGCGQRAQREHELSEDAGEVVGQTPTQGWRDAYEVSEDVEDVGATETTPHAHHSFELSVFRDMDLTVDKPKTRVTAATPTTPPVYALPPSARFRTLAGLDSNFPLEARRTSNPTQLLVFNRGRVLIDTGHFRVHPTDASRFQVRLRGLVCHPARAAGSTQLPAGTERFPVAILIHGNHTALDFSLADSGAPRTTVTSGSTTFTLIPARATLRHEVVSYRGYRYLQEHLAGLGIVSLSIDTNAANELDSRIRFRADLVLEALDHLRSLDASSSSPFYRRLDFSKVALVGHSRGGDAVALAAELNRTRSTASKYGLRAVVAIAPTDFTGMLDRTERLRMRSDRTASFLCVYGSHDGDVSGAFDPADLSQGWGFVGTGFRHYDRASTQRAMVFIHGATHNRFNSVWVDPAAHASGSPARSLAESQADNFDDEPSVDPRRSAAPAGTRDPRVLTSAVHQTLAREYVGGWLALWLRRDFSEQRRFNGSQANSLGVPVGLQWRLGRALRGIDDFDNSNPATNVLGGANTSPPFVSERLIELVDLAHVPHHDRVLAATQASGASRIYRTDIPAAKRDWSTFTALTFRFSKHFARLATAAEITATSFPPNLQIALFDGSVRASVDQSVIAPLNPRTVRPYLRFMGTDNLTKVHMQTWQIPLANFTASGLSLTAIEAVEITFDATATEPIHLDTLTVVRI